MASLFATVDRQSGNFESNFIYSLNASFSGIVGQISSAQIKIFFPDFLNVYLGDTKDPVKSATATEVSGGTEVVYDFGQITDLGIAVRLGFGVTFKAGTANGTAFTAEPIMFINGEQALSSQSAQIALSVTPRFEISREIILPSIEPAPGGEVYFRLTLENYGDLGTAAESISITCFGTDSMAIDESFEVVGADASSKFADKEADGTVGSFADNSMVFNIPSYSGQRYRFIYKAIISPDALIGDQITSDAVFVHDGEQSQTEVHDVQLSAPLYDAEVSIYCPDYTLPNEYLCYRMRIENIGNQALLNAVFTNELPVEVAFYKFETGSFSIGAIGQSLGGQYTIEYDTVNGNGGVFGTFSTDVSSEIMLSDFIESDDRLSVLRWRLQGITVGLSELSPPTLYGIVNADVPLASDILDHIHLDYQNAEGEQFERFQNATTIVDNICVLRPTLQSSVGTNPIRPGDMLSLSMTVRCNSSRLQNPIFAILLPAELNYIGNEKFKFTDVFTETSPVMPAPTVIADFTETGETLVKYQFSDEFAFSFRQLATATITFDAQVAVGAYGQISCSMLCNTVGSVGRIPSNFDVYYDKYNIADDSTVDTKYCMSNEIPNRILFFVSTSSDKKVKGALDSDYVEQPLVGKTYEGGKLEYKITVKNIGNSDLTGVEIVDILPYVGDSAVISPTTPRASEFNVYSISDVVAKLLPDEQTVDFDIQYSKSKDPIRFGPAFDVIGTDDDWSEDLPEDMTQLRAFKVKTKEVVLRPSEYLQVEVFGSVPVGVLSEQVAWNSFAADVTYLDINDVQQRLLAIEPEKVGISINETAPDTVELGGFVWLDSSGEGIFTPDEPFVNDVGVMLLDENRVVIAVAFTTPDASGKNGQYLFKNLPKGKYFVRFFIDNANYRFTTRRLDDPSGSLVDASTGISPLIDMSEATSNRAIKAGIVPKQARSIDELLKINNSARSIMRDVVKSQMLLVMKEEDILDLIEGDF